jgi:hypothetical protein
MKRDMELVRAILQKIESDDGNLDVEGCSLAQFLYHCELLEEAGLIVAQFVRDGQGEPAGVRVQRLTNAGHDFLDASRSDTVWKKFRAATLKVGGGVAIPVAVELLKKLTAIELGL